MLVSQVTASASPPKRTVGEPHGWIKRQEDAGAAQPAEMVACQGFFVAAPLAFPVCISYLLLHRPRGSWAPHGGIHPLDGAQAVIPVFNLLRRQREGDPSHLALHRVHFEGDRDIRFQGHCDGLSTASMEVSHLGRTREPRPNWNH